MVLKDPTLKTIAASSMAVAVAKAGISTFVNSSRLTHAPIFVAMLVGLFIDSKWGTVAPRNSWSYRQALHVPATLAVTAGQIGLVRAGGYSSAQAMLLAGAAVAIMLLIVDLLMNHCQMTPNRRMRTP